ncbi:unnamed protein product [Strongylus vulgaris]|uniref:O-acyltransferase n=1 Tax=Strongylus vulgaris TaxID=40348 RepID=A0A3P7IP35_STRVU|nr:unnamed protein product [Strongylus vulgaris]
MGASEEELRRRHPSAASKTSSNDSWSPVGSQRKLSFAQRREREFSKGPCEKIVHRPQDSLFSSSSGWTNYRGFFNLAMLLLATSVLLFIPDNQFRPCEKIVHRPQDSLFSSSSGWTNYRGFFNLAMLLLVVSNGRVALENLIKYGILISPLQWLSFMMVDASFKNFPNLLLVLFSNATILIVFVTEKILEKGYLSNYFAAIFYPIVVSIHLAYPAAVTLILKVLLLSFSLFFGFVNASYVCLSFVSQCAREERLAARKVDHISDIGSSEMASLYPSTLTLSNLYYFMFAPTLCYELNKFSATVAVFFVSAFFHEYLVSVPMHMFRLWAYYGMMSQIPLSFLTDHVIKGGRPGNVVVWLSLILGQPLAILMYVHDWYNFIFPYPLSSHSPPRKCLIISFERIFACVSPFLPSPTSPPFPQLIEFSLFINFTFLDYRCLERLLKLAIPNLIIWLIGFYTIFHSLLNLVAEILKFADREFYRDFWNSETIQYFWRTWNIPVHRWAARHVYMPMVRNHYHKFSATVAVFFVSAFFHEYLVSVPMHMFRLWAYYGMMSQIPLSYLTDNVIKGGRPGNVVVWLSLILGQPLAILMYVHDWYVMYQINAELHPGKE